MNLEILEALATFAETGSMTRAALRLRLTQSAVSKRIATLEAETGRKLVERDGRNVRLTAEGRALLSRTASLMAQIRDALAAETPRARTEVEVGVSESILASWGAAVFASAAVDEPGVEIRLHAHRSPVAIERVRHGTCALALVAGTSDGVPGLVTQTVLQEEMVIVPRGLDSSALRVRNGRSAAPIDVLAIEEHSATHRALAPRMARLRRAAGVDLRVTDTLESYGALVALAREGLGHALAPIGIVRAMGVRDAQCLRIPAPGLHRPVSLVARKTALARGAEASVRTAVLRALPRGDGYRSSTSAGS